MQSCHLGFLVVLVTCQLTSAFLPSPLRRRTFSQSPSMETESKLGISTSHTSQWWSTTKHIFLKAEQTSGDDSDDVVKLIIAGAPASGKGTQCEVIKDKYGVVHLSTGDMLRAAVAAGTDVGKQAKDFMDSGKLVPDDVIIGVVSSGLDLVMFWYTAFFNKVCFSSGERSIDGVRLC